jgi:hypothetical protein
MIQPEQLITAITGGAGLYRDESTQEWDCAA